MKAHLFNQAAATQLAEDAGQRMIQIHFVIAIGAEHQYRYVRQ